MFTRAQLFKTNDFISCQNIKISNILCAKMLPIFAKKKCDELLHCILQKFHNNFSAKYTATIDFVRLNESMTNDFMKLVKL